MRFLRRVKDFFVPNARNVYRPGVLGKRSLLFFLAVTLVAEGFLVANLVGRHSFGDFVAAVIGSEIVSLTNVERAEAAMSTLRENAVLAQAAQAKAEHMASNSYFAHVGPDGKQPWAWVAEAGYEYRYAGENLAVRFVDSSDVVEAWMDSPSHRANIIKPVYEEIGIGIAEGTYKGSRATFVVQFFGTPLSVAAASAQAAPDTPLPAPQPPGIPEVAGESIAAVFDEAIENPGAAESLLKTTARAFAEPRAATSFILGAVAGILLAVVALAFFVHLQIQPTDLLLKGSLVAAFALALIGINAHGLGAAPGWNGQAAAVGGPLGQENSAGVVISEAGETTERFVVEF